MKKTESAQEIRIIPVGVNAAKGFKAAGCEAGIKYEHRKDMAMVLADVPCAVAGTYTSNHVKAAPVIWNMEKVKSGKKARAIIARACFNQRNLLPYRRTFCAWDLPLRPACHPVSAKAPSAFSGIDSNSNTGSFSSTGSSIF